MTAENVPLPKLKNLLLCDMVFGLGSGRRHKGFSKDRLARLVRDRNKAGYGLRELEIQACIGFGPKQVRECEKFVSKVVWDEGEGEDFPHACTHHNHYLDYDDDDDLSFGGEYDAHYQIYGRNPWDIYDSDGLDDYLPYY